MADINAERLPKFSPQDVTACGSEWQSYKRQFEIYLDAKGLHDANGRRKVGQLLSCMGPDHVATYDTFTWAEAVPAVEANRDAGIVARAAVPAEDRYNLQHVFRKFDAFFGVHQYRSIKRQEFLSCTRGPKQSVQSFIAELKRKAQHCDYGDREEGLIVDMLINRVNDRKCTERLMELTDADLTIPNAMRVCRQVELTNSHLESLNSVKNEEHVHRTQPQRGQSRGNSRNRFSRNRDYNRGGAKGNDDRYRDGERRKPPCDRCCGKHGRDNRCPAFDRYCGSCGEKGHYQRSPRCSQKHSQSRDTTSRTRRTTGTVPRGGRQRRVHYTDDDVEYDNYDDNYDDDNDVYGYNGYENYDDDHDVDDVCESFSTAFKVDVQNVDACVGSRMSSKLLKNKVDVVEKYHRMYLEM